MGVARAPDGDRILGFDGLRAIAFLLVFVSHKTQIAHHDSYGDVGVYLFFVLSGFLITRILARSRERMESHAQNFASALGQFYARRTARIFPVYYLTLAFWTVVALFVALPDFDPMERLAHWTYTTNILIGWRDQWVGRFGHLWTLAVEEQFYLLFAPIALLLPRKHTWAACAAFVLVGVGAKIALEALRAPAISIDVNSLVNFALLGLGGLVGLNADKAAARWRGGGLAQSVTLILFVAAPLAAGGSSLWPLGAKLTGIIAALLLFQVYRGQQTWFVRLLNSAPLRMIGRVSYGAYLFHPFLHLAFVDHLLLQAGLASATAKHLTVGADLIGAIALAALSWAALERPIIAWVKRRSDKS